MIESSFEIEFHFKTSQFLKRQATNFFSIKKKIENWICQNTKHINVEHLPLQKKKRTDRDGGEQNHDMAENEMHET